MEHPILDFINKILINEADEPKMNDKGIKENKVKK